MLNRYWSRLRALKHINVLSLAALALSVLLLLGAFYFPFIHSSFELELPDWIPDWFGLHEELSDWVVKKGRIPTGDQYLLGIIISLFKEGSIFLGIVIFLFSVVFPVLKIALSGVYVVRSMRKSLSPGNTLFNAIGLVSKWSMADVFIVAVIIVMFKAKGFNFTFTAQAGIYCYAVSAVLSSLVISLISHKSVDAS